MGPGTTPITASNLRIRKTFAKNKQVIEIPNLIELQKKSYEAFLQKKRIQTVARTQAFKACLNRYSLLPILIIPQVLSSYLILLSRPNMTSMSVVSGV